MILLLSRRSTFALLAVLELEGAPSLIVAADRASAEFARGSSLIVIYIPVHAIHWCCYREKQIAVPFLRERERARDRCRGENVIFKCLLKSTCVNYIDIVYFGESLACEFVVCPSPM